MDLNGIKDLSVKIYPKELGEVFISVTMEHGALKASIKATSKDAVEMLNLGLRDINEKINFDNSKIQSVDIGLYNEDTTYFSNGNLNQNQQHESEQFMRKNSRNQDMLVEEEVIMEPIMHESAVNLLV
nr:flagellar hook-length control protein FliK [Clostridium punense]